MKNLEIVEYKPSYASEVARMWRMSTEGWNGCYANETEENILTMHESNININTFLALCEEEVLGYCSLLEYPSDEGALWIKLLNTRYDCHGKGIGKAIIKKVVQRAIELDYPRIDLYTWASNKKSIPFYKRCGFFLENSQYAHLMNFIPYVLQTEAVKDYFENADWYHHLKRKIDMETEGREEQGFEFYEYNWEKDGRKLRMEFERRGRGLRLIETDDYRISLIAEEQNLLFGKWYKAVYEIVNKTGESLKVEIKGQKDKNIKFNLNKTVDVVQKEVVQGEFFIEPIEEEITDLKTHPSVVSEILINGKKALFKLGIVPKIPAKISLSSESIERYEGETSKMYLNIESNLYEDGILEFELPENENMEIQCRTFNIEMKKYEIKSIEIPFVFKKPTIYSAELNVNAHLKSGVNFKFNTKIIEFLKGRKEAFGGETKDSWVIVNGSYSVILNKGKNYINFEKFDKQFNKTLVLCPKLGMPYSTEFNNKRAKNVQWYKDNDYMILKAGYVFREYPQIVLTLVIKLSADGIVESYYEILNISENDTGSEIWVKQEIDHDELIGAVVPYDNKFVKLSELALEETTPFKSERFNENWIFFGDKNNSRSIWWDKDLKISFGEWPYIYFEHNLGKIEGKSKKVTKSVYTALTTFETWQDLRSFAQKESKQFNGNITSDFEVNINNNNPFVKENFTVELIQHKQSPFKGKITAESQRRSVSSIKRTIDEKSLSVKFHAQMADKADIDIVSIKPDIGLISFEKKSALFKIKNVEIEKEITDIDGLKVYSINNGVIEIKASPNYSSGIYSLNYKNHEYLDSSFPKLGMRTWFNPWFGGMQTVPRNWIVNSKALLKEEITTDFVDIVDRCGNQWQGIKTSVSIDHNEEYTGLVINEYYLMLPGVPVLCHTVEIINNMGKYMKDQLFATKNFFNINNDITKNYISFKNCHGEITTYKPGIEDCNFYPDSSLLYGNNDIEEKVQIYINYEKCMQRGIINTSDNLCVLTKNLNMKDGERIFTEPTFYILTNEHIPNKLLKDLKNIRF